MCVVYCVVLCFCVVVYGADGEHRCGDACLVLFSGFCLVSVWFLSALLLLLVLGNEDL